MAEQNGVAMTARWPVSAAHGDDVAVRCCGRLQRCSTQPRLRREQRRMAHFTFPAVWRRLPHGPAAGKYSSLYHLDPAGQCYFRARDDLAVGKWSEHDGHLSGNGASKMALLHLYNRRFRPTSCIGVAGLLRRGVPAALCGAAAAAGAERAGRQPAPGPSQAGGPQQPR